MAAALARASYWRDGKQLARGAAGPSALAHGRPQAWDAILRAIDDAFAQAHLTLPALSVLQSHADCPA
jgi:N-acetylglucosamine kinase-like BadF-type ATPase